MERSTLFSVESSKKPNISWDVKICWPISTASKNIHRHTHQTSVFYEKVLLIRIGMCIFREKENEWGYIHIYNQTHDEECLVISTKLKFVFDFSAFVDCFWQKKFTILLYSQPTINFLLVIWRKVIELCTWGESETFLFGFILSFKTIKFFFSDKDENIIFHSIPMNKQTYTEGTWQKKKEKYFWPFYLVVSSLDILSHLSFGI